MDGADARTGQHRDDRLWRHRHVEDDAVALLDPQVLQNGAENSDFIAQLGVGERLGLLGNRAIVDQRLLPPPSAQHVTVQAVVGCIAFSAHEPAAVLAGVWVKNLVPQIGPIDVARGFCPERLRVLFPGGIHLVVTAHAARLHLGACQQRSYRQLRQGVNIVPAQRGKRQDRHARSSLRRVEARSELPIGCAAHSPEGRHGR